MEPNELIQTHNLNHYNNDQMNRVYSEKGISPTVVVVSGGGREVKILESQAKKLGCKGPEEISKTIRVGGQNTLTKKHNWNHINDGYRIRKLTPYECLILMGLSHEDAMKLINSGISNSQLYKMAGNSIITNCMRFLKKLEAIDILNEDLPKGQLSLF